MTRAPYLLFEDSVYGPDGRLDLWNWRWQPGAAPAGATEVSACEVLSRTRNLVRRQIPVGIIGPRDCDEDKAALATRVGAAIGALGLTMICGGRTGIMAAAAKGCRGSGGLTVGLLPGHDWREANDDIMLPIATGLSEARNVVIAKSCAVLVAVGGSPGTLTEMAFGLHFSKPVIVLDDAPDLPGTERASDAEDAAARLAAHLLARAALS